MRLDNIFTSHQAYSSLPYSSLPYSSLLFTSRKTARGKWRISLHSVPGFEHHQIQPYELVMESFNGLTSAVLSLWWSRPPEAVTTARRRTSCGGWTGWVASLTWDILRVPRHHLIIISSHPSSLALQGKVREARTGHVTCPEHGDSQSSQPSVFLDSWIRNSWSRTRCTPNQPARRRNRRHLSYAGLLHPSLRLEAASPVRERLIR